MMGLFFFEMQGLTGKAVPFGNANLPIPCTISVQLSREGAISPVCLPG